MLGQLVSASDLSEGKGRRDEGDESGQVTNEKIVGKFKGRIRIYNKEEDEAYQAEKKARMDQIFELLGDIHVKVFGNPLDVGMADLQS